MITAKNQFNLEREQIGELQYLLNNSTLSAEELEQVVYKLNDPITEGEYDELKKELTDRQISARDRIRNGEIVKQVDVNLAVMQAIKSE